MSTDSPTTGPVILAKPPCVYHGTKPQAVTIITDRWVQNIDGDKVKASRGDLGTVLGVCHHCGSRLVILTSAKELSTGGRYLMPVGILRRPMNPGLPEGVKAIVEGDRHQRKHPTDRPVLVGLPAGQAAPPAPAALASAPTTTTPPAN